VECCVCVIRPRWLRVSLPSMLLFMSYDFGTLGRAYVETDEARADEPTIMRTF
jgi:hypothetical protein